MTTRRTDLRPRCAPAFRSTTRKRIGRIRRVAVAAAIAGLGVVLPGQAGAITENYCSFPASLATVTYNGNAFEAGNGIRLTTNNTSSEASSAFLTSPITLTGTTSFHAFFRFQMGPAAAGGDGIAFVLQNSALGAAALGGTAGNMGYAGTAATRITPSVIIEFDTYRDATDTNANHVGLMLNGSTTHTAQTPPSFTMAGGGILDAWVDYNFTTTTLSVYVSQTATKPATPVLSHTINVFTQLGSTMYVGFTSSTGLTTSTPPEINEHDVYELEFSTDGVPCACESDPACTGSPATPACGASGFCAVCSATNHTACTGATPVCDVPTNTCVGCLSDSECSGPKPICDATLLACRACTSNADCGGTTPPQCDTLAGSANLGVCVACVADLNCPPAAPRCNPATNACEQCLTGTDCGGDTPVCKSGQCQKCASDTDCSGATPACEVWGACGQCSSTNAAACTGGTGVCDHPTGACVACEFNPDCVGATPTCNTTTHTCAPCATNPDCNDSQGGPACATSGMKSGSCVGCLADTDCTSSAAPRCDTISTTCVGCLANGDCKAPTPVCGPANLCVGCGASADCTTAAPVCDTNSATCKPCQNDYATQNPGPLSCPTAALPACQPTGATLAGQCGQCSSINNTLCASQATTPTCVTASATCGCLKDTDCNADSYCDTATVSAGTCAAGCRVVNGVDNCATGEYCTMSGGSVGTCMGEPCNSNTDCKAPTPVCDTLAQPQVCVQCINDSDCTMGLVCDGKNHCAQCTSTDKKNCTASGVGSACLGTETCGCTTDSDCGGATSGRICDAASSACVAGCRGTSGNMGGNGCPAGMTCSASGGAVGTCGTATAPMDAGMATMDAGAVVEAGTGDASTVNGASGGSSGGCGCRVVSGGAGGDDVLAAGFGAIALALGRIARRRRKAA
jgi:hypothetical protein